MIKLIIFDLDGVLVSTKDLHYISLNKALSNIDNKYEISRKDHYERYDGLPTMKKLKMLTVDKNLPVEYYDQINRDKQKYTFDLIRELIKRDDRLIEIVKKLKDDGYTIYVASNSIRETTKLLLYYTGIIEYVDIYISNEDVKNPKPNPEMYLKCMIEAGVSPNETLIIEDSPRGIEAVHKSKANLLIVENPDSVTYEKIINQINMKKEETQRLKLSNFNILIPMAGEGSRFQKAGYTFPKPMIEVNGKPMIQLVVENLGFEANYIYVVRKEHYDNFNLKSFLNLITPNCKIVIVDKLTEGAACTTLLAKEHINNDNPLIIANSDQFIEWNPTDFYYNMIETKADGGIVTFSASHPKWSFVKINEQGNAIQVAEKDPISTIATCFHYNQYINVDGKSYPIGYVVNNKISGKILSYNIEKNLFEYKNIVNWIRRDGTKSDWYSIKLNDLKLQNNMIVTGDHEFLTNKGWISVENIYNEKFKTNLPDMSFIQKQIFYGTLLGDSSIKRIKRDDQCFLSFSHSTKQKEWFEMKKNVFSNFNQSTYYTKPYVKGKIKSSGSYCSNFSFNPIWKKEHAKWYSSGRKIIPTDLIFDRFLLATWYMDDGNISVKTPRFSVNCFDEKCVDLLMKKFLEIDIETYKYIDSTSTFRLCVKVSSSDKFYNMICELIPQSMQYKLPEKFRNRYNQDLWDNIDKNNFYFSNVSVKNLIDTNHKHYLKYAFCIEVEDNHNFVIGNSISHNCGIYYYKKGADYIKYAEQMISKDIRVRGEFYVCPIFNEFIGDDKKIKIYNIEKMWGIGTPEDLEYFIENYK